jgi:hypothetical protein
MNWKQMIIVISAFVFSVLIVWHDLPIEFPGTIIKVLMLFVKLSLVVALAIFAYIFAADKKKSS